MALARVLEPEVMDSADDALDYDRMDHAAVNRQFVDDLLAAATAAGVEIDESSEILDLGTGTAQIPVELLSRRPKWRVRAVDLAESMMELGRQNVAAAGFSDRIRLARVDAKRLPYPAGRYALVMSNSIVHHIPEPRDVLAEACRVLRPGGLLFIRDLLRPADDAAVRSLVATYAADCNDHQRQLFDDSLRAALNLDEVRRLVAELGHDPLGVNQTSDRHWTWTAS
ncbi:MAG TPA: class I SAM-dependent methyltransferase [Pirellulales bacterium]|nr:class I SAM-dependent methyltransferase [Pirellulales bacterium]